MEIKETKGQKDFKRYLKFNKNSSYKFNGYSQVSDVYYITNSNSIIFTNRVDDFKEKLGIKEIDLNFISEGVKDLYKTSYELKNDITTVKTRKTILEEIKSKTDIFLNAKIVIDYKLLKITFDLMEKQNNYEILEVENGIYIRSKNDIAFILGKRIK